MPFFPTSLPLSEVRRLWEKEILFFVERNQGGKMVDILAILLTVMCIAAFFNAMLDNNYS
jgi:hypothetical protein